MHYPFGDTLSVTKRGHNPFYVTGTLFLQRYSDCCILRKRTCSTQDHEITCTVNVYGSNLHTTPIVKDSPTYIHTL
jgi:hypothetical protein